MVRMENFRESLCEAIIARMEREVSVINAYMLARIVYEISKSNGELEGKSIKKLLEEDEGRRYLLVADYIYDSREEFYGDIKRGYDVDMLINEYSLLGLGDWHVLE